MAGQLPKQMKEEMFRIPVRLPLPAVQVALKHAEVMDWPVQAYAGGAGGMAAPVAPAPVLQDDKELRPPTVDDFVFTVQPAGGCSTALVSGFSVRGRAVAGHFGGEWINGQHVIKKVDWSFPLPDDFIKAMSEKFDKTAQPGMYSSAPDTLLATTVCADSKEWKATHRALSGSKYGDGGEGYRIIEHILERTGWMRGGCGMGQHNYPVQAWTRPSRGIQMAYKE